jgi:hypothetical protein
MVTPATKVCHLLTLNQSAPVSFRSCYREFLSWYGFLFVKRVLCITFVCVGFNYLFCCKVEDGVTVTQGLESQRSGFNLLKPEVHLTNSMELSPPVAQPLNNFPNIL